MKRYLLFSLVVLLTVITLILGIGITPPANSTVLNGSVADSIDSNAVSADTSPDSSINWSEFVNKDQISLAWAAPKEKLKGKNVLITMGGMGAKLEWVQGWTEELYRAKLIEFNIGLVIAVKGPREEYYDAREIAIRDLTKRFVDAYREYGMGETYLIVHSSGVFPAHEMFDHLWLGGDDPKSKKQKPRKLEVIDTKGITKNKINYIMLDGELGIPKGYTLIQEMVVNLKKLYSFYAIDADTKTLSGMAHEAKKVKEKFPETVLHEFIAKNSGCNPGAKWCVHETLITTRPHNPARYDLEKDYTMFDSTRRVVTEYMDIVNSYCY
ncbi:MAG: hypothetical protein HBSAPP04_00390 [Ignavibacteriaceae bacterium]|nr:MAG: hypothetical protein HBSAPP04_00390 [Ignavibacteriaceae bacterium]